MLTALFDENWSENAKKESKIWARKISVWKNAPHASFFVWGRKMKRALLVADSPGWAYDIEAQSIKRHASKFGWEAEVRLRQKS